MEVSALWFNTQFTLGKIPHVLRLRSLDGKILRPAVDVHFESEFYRVKTINRPEELLQVLSLRFEVFFREFSTQKVSFSFFPYDVDVYDFLCDHLVVIDKAQDRVVACYRLLSSNQKGSSRFYSEGEFVLDEFLQKEGVKLELGRACVHRDHRKGAVISLLWKGLLDYAKKARARYMFGCSSIPRKDFAHLDQTLLQIGEQRAFIDEYNVGVREKYKLRESLTQGQDKVPRPVSSLMHMYLMAGAKMGRELAYDREMDCLDLLTVMDLSELPPSFERRFS